jgi:preprotein translocase subunit SecG
MIGITGTDYLIITLIIVVMFFGGMLVLVNSMCKGDRDAQEAKEQQTNIN